MDVNRPVYFVTGATGNLGAAVFRRLLGKPDTELRILLRPGSEAFFRFALRDAGLSLTDNVQFVTGDIALPLCGVDPARLQGVTDIVHCAADVRWRAPPDQLFAANVSGWRNLLDLAACLDRSSSLRLITAVSTAYVAPRRVGRQGTAPATAYETSKILAERLTTGCRLPITIVRPSTLVGDSASGRIESFTAAYFLLRLLADRQIPCLPGYANALADLVPVDHAANAIIAVHRSPDPPRILSITRGMRAAPLRTVWSNAAALLDELTPLARPRRAGFFLPPAPSRAALSLAGNISRRAGLSDLASYIPYVSRRDALPSSVETELPDVPLREFLEPMIHFAVSVGFQSTRRRFANTRSGDQ